nr:helix-turn-helix domain-containing protein [Haladaptatus paucihalophilus]
MAYDNTFYVELLSLEHAGPEITIPSTIHEEVSSVELERTKLLAGYDSRRGIMREFTFGIEYDATADPVMEVFIENPEMTAHSLDSCVTEDQFWRIERITGPTAALNRIEELRFDDTICGESITEIDCTATRHHDVLKRTNNERVLYTYLEGISGCESVHTLAGRYLPSGLIFETHRQEDRHDWRILMRSDEKVGMLYDSLGAALRSSLTFRMGHLRDAEGWQQDTLAAVSLPTSQRAALKVAIENGYYETPRQIKLDDLADQLDMPRSTLSYRLRQAEAKLARGYIGESVED